MASTIGRGLLAGAVGTTLLNAATYLDMALTDRAPSSAPAQTTSRALARLGVSPPPGRNRPEAYGAVAGIAAGLGVGVVAAVARRAGVRLPAPVGAAAVGALAMAAADAPMAALGVRDPRTGSAADWTRDVVPHLVYGIGVRWTLDRTEPRATASPADSAAPGIEAGPAASPFRALVKSLLVGVAAGGRSSLGLAAPLLTARAPRVRLAGAAVVAAELVGDKLPSTPSRLESGPLLGRAGAGAVSGAFVAARGGHPARALVGAVLGVTGAVAGSVLGAAFREVAAGHGWTWQAALAEDAAALGLAAYALS